MRYIQVKVILRANFDIIQYVYIKSVACLIS